MMTESRIPESLATALVTVLGVWSLHAWACVYTGTTFSLLRLILPFSLVVSGGVTWWLIRECATPQPPPPAEIHPADRISVYSIGTLVLAGVALAAWHRELVPFAVAWVAALLHLATLLPSASIGPATPTRATRWDLGALALAAIVAVIATTGLSRPDSDDAYYFNAVLAALAHPELAALSFDGMHGDVTVPIQQLIHRPQSYELLAAAVASIPGISPTFAYYVLLPAVMAAATPLAYWMVAKTCTPRTAWLAILLAVPLVLAWGDGHRTFGNYGFVRLFQGKAVYMCVFVPLVVWTGWAYASAPSPAAWLRLVLAQCAAAGLTSSALVVTPICAGIAVLAGAQPTRRGLKVLAFGALSSLPLLVVLAILKWEMYQLGPLISSGGIFKVVALIGTGWRGPISLFGLLALPFLAHAGAAPNAAWITRYVGLAFLFIFNGISGPLLGEWVAELLSWRLFWTIPLPALVAVAMAAALIGPREKTNSSMVTQIVTAMALWTFVTAQPWTTDADNHVTFSWGGAKRPERDIATIEKIMEQARPTSLVLAPEQLAVWLTGLENAPRLVSVRKFYTDNLRRHWGIEESRARMKLVRLVQGRLKSAETEVALDALIERCIDIVVVHRSVNKTPNIRNGLADRGYKSLKHDRHFIWRLENEAFQACSQ